MPKYQYQPTKRKDIKKYQVNGNTYYAVFFRVKDYSGKTRQIHRHGLRTIREAEHYIRTEKARHAGKATIPLRIVAQEYLESLTRYGNPSPNTLAAKKSQIKRIVNTFGDMPVCDIKPANIVEWQKNLLKTLKPQSVNICKACLSCILKYAMIYYDLASNPARIAPNLKVTENERKKKNLWTDVDLERALIHEEEYSLQVLWMLLYYSGLRIGEARGLTPSDIMEDGVMVERQKTQVGNLLRSPKSGSSGLVCIHPAMIDILRTYVEINEIKEYLFPYNYSVIHTRLKHLCEKAHVPMITPHDFRHSSLTNDAQRGTPLIALQSKARHKRASTTEKYYIHPSENSQRILMQFNYNLFTPPADWQQ